ISRRQQNYLAQLFVDDLFLLIGEDGVRLSHRVGLDYQQQRSRVDSVCGYLGFAAKVARRHQMIVALKPEQPTAQSVRDEFALRWIEAIASRSRRMRIARSRRNGGIRRRYESDQTKQQ